MIPRRAFSGVAITAAGRRFVPLTEQKVTFSSRPPPHQEGALSNVSTSQRVLSHQEESASKIILAQTPQSHHEEIASKNSFSQEPPSQQETPASKLSCSQELVDHHEESASKISMSQTPSSYQEEITSNIRFSQKPLIQQEEPASKKPNFSKGPVYHRKEPASTINFSQESLSDQKVAHSKIMFSQGSRSLFGQEKPAPKFSFSPTRQEELASNPWVSRPHDSSDIGAKPARKDDAGISETAARLLARTAWYRELAIDPEVSQRLNSTENYDEAHTDPRRLILTDVGAKPPTPTHQNLVLPSHIKESRKTALASAYRCLPMRWKSASHISVTGRDYAEVILPLLERCKRQPCPVLRHTEILSMTQQILRQRQEEKAGDAQLGTSKSTEVTPITALDKSNTTFVQDPDSGLEITGIAGISPEDLGLLLSFSGTVPEMSCERVLQLLDAIYEAEPWREVEKGTPWEGLKYRLMERSKFERPVDLFDCVKRLKAQDERRYAGFVGVSPKNMKSIDFMERMDSLDRFPTEIQEKTLWTFLVAFNKALLVECLVDFASSRKNEGVLEFLRSAQLNAAPIRTVLLAAAAQVAGVSLDFELFKNSKFLEILRIENLDANLFNIAGTLIITAVADPSNQSKLRESASIDALYSEETGLETQSQPFDTTATECPKYTPEDIEGAIQRLKLLASQRALSKHHLRVLTRPLHYALALGYLTPPQQVTIARVYAQQRYPHVTFFRSLARQIELQMQLELQLCTAHKGLFETGLTENTALPTQNASNLSSVSLNPSEILYANISHDNLIALHNSLLSSLTTKGALKSKDHRFCRMLHEWRRSNFTWAAIPVVIHAAETAGYGLKSSVATDGQSLGSLWTTWSIMAGLSAADFAKIPLGDFPAILSLLPDFQEYKVNKKPSLVKKKSPAESNQLEPLLQQITFGMQLACKYLIGEDKANLAAKIADILQQYRRLFLTHTDMPVLDRREIPIPRKTRVYDFDVPTWITTNEECPDDGNTHVPTRTPMATFLGKILYDIIPL